MNGFVSMSGYLHHLWNYLDTLIKIAFLICLPTSTIYWHHKNMISLSLERYPTIEMKYTHTNKIKVEMKIPKFIHQVPEMLNFVFSFLTTLYAFTIDLVFS